jgi:exodeoxyribonuclease V alpha subunit
MHCQLNLPVQQIPEITFSPFDLHFAEFLSDLNTTDNQNVFVSAALASNALHDGHSCINLPDFAGKELIQSNLPFSFNKFPSLDTWITTLRSSAVTGQPGDYTPLILDKNRLYLFRYWNYENQLAQFLTSSITTAYSTVNTSVEKQIGSLFPGNQDLFDLQHVAVITALFNKCTIISGGPGTGKTTTVAKILALLLQVFGIKLRIALTAPTGKAAARLSSSISAVKETLAIDEQIKQSIPEKATTLHRLLGIVPHSPYVFHNASNPLPYDVVLIDEASMVDLALMSKCIQALPPKCKLILLGDKDQLSSVEAGSVLGDICDTGTPHFFTEEYCKIIQPFIPQIAPSQKTEPPFANCIVTLKKSYRFNESSGIGLLSKAINDGDSDTAFDILNRSDQAECCFKNLQSDNQFFHELNSYTQKYYQPLLSNHDPQKAFRYLDSFRILCAVRQGPSGVDVVNEHITSILLHRKSDNQKLFPGKAIMITGNNYVLNVFNGDTAVLMPNESDENSLKAAFRNQDGTIRYMLLRQLPHWESAFALTVHKSQGSEFDNILLILPLIPSPILTRELLYTAVTRAKKRIEIWGNPQILKNCISSKIIRTSGLREKLWDLKP